MAGDVNTSPTGATDVNDTASNPSSVSATVTSGSSPQVDTTSTDTPQQIQPQPTQQMPTAGQPAQQQQQGQPGKQPDLSKNPQQPSPDQVQQQKQQQQIDHAGHFYKVAEALAGGPRYKETIDPNTGVMQKTKVPLSRGDLGMAIALEAVTGALSGLAQRGPGAEGRAAASGFDTVAQKQQEAQQQQDAQANADFTRHYQAAEANMRLRQNAMTLSGQDFDQHAKHVEQFKDMALQFQHDFPQAVRAAAINESDLSKYHFTKDNAIPVNVVPKLDPQTGKQMEVDGVKQWEEQYMIVDPNFKASSFLTDDDRKTLAEMGKSGFVDSDGNASNLPQDIMMRTSMALNYKSQASSYRMAKDDLANFYNEVGGKAPDLAAAIKQDPTLGEALIRFEPLLNATGRDYGKAIGELGAKDPQTAGKILSLFGGTDTVKKFDQAQADAAEAAKKKTDRSALYDTIDTEDKANAVLADPKSFTSEQVAAAQKFHQQSSRDKANNAYAEGEAHAQADIDVKKRNGIPLTSGNSVADMIKDPKIQGIQVDPAESQLTDGVNTAYLDKIKEANPNLADLINQIGHGQQMQSAYALAKNDGQVLGSMVARAFPGYQFQKAESFGKMYQSFTSGKDKDQIEAANTTYRHLSALYDAAGKTSSLIPGTEAKADFDTDADKALEEIHSAYTPGVQHQEQYDRAARNIHSIIPSVRQEAVRDMANLLSDKSGEKQNSYRRGKPTEKIADFDIVSPEAQSAFQHVTGRYIGKNGMTDPVAGSGGQPQNNTPSHVVPKGATPGRDAKGNIIGYKNADGTVVRF